MITVQLTDADYVAANRLHYRWTRNDWLTYGLGYILLLLAGGLLLSSGDSPDHIYAAGAILIYLPLALWACMAIGRFFLVPRQARKLFHQNKGARAPYDITWDGDRMSITSENYMQRSLWSDFLKWREDNQMILLYYTNVQFRIVPKRAFPDSATRDAFIRFVHDKVPAHKSHRF